MNREALESLDKETLIRLALSQAETIAGLTRQVEMLTARVAELEAKLGLPPKTPDNSSTPPSQGRKSSQAAAAGDRKVKGKPHPGAHRGLHPNPTTRIAATATHCSHCGTDVSGRAQIACEAYDHIEIPSIKPDVTRITLFGGTCPCCARKFKAPAPEGFPQRSPFGPNLRALVIYLRFTQGIAFARLARLVSDLLGLEISEGALVNILNATRDAFSRQTSLIRARLMSGSALESDETGLRVGKRNWWLWVFHHKDNAVFVVEPSRGKGVPAAFLGEHRPDFWVSDRYGAQLGWAAKENQVCLAHLIRDVQYAIDDGDGIFAPALRHLLGRACRIGRQRERLADATLRTYAARLESRLDDLMRLTPRHAAGVKLQRVIKKIRRHLFVFVTNRAIPPTNNGSERALRPCVTFRKITNGFRTEWGARLYADIRSVFETARRRGIPLLQSIRLTLDGRPLPIGAPIGCLP
jgi:transposase